MLLHLEAVGLAVLTVVLAGPVSSALARARWPARSPRAALVLWQAVGLGGGLGILTAGLTLSAGSTGQRWWPGLIAIPRHVSRLGLAGWIGIALTGCVGAWLVSATTASTARVLRARRVHRRRLDLIADAQHLTSPITGRGGLEIRLVDHPQAVAYCLPGFRPRVVLSSGALISLTEGERDVVLAHEHAHARGHHDLVTQPFIAWAQTFPFLPTAARAVDAVDLLVEMLADDAALRRCRPEDLRSAIHRLAPQESIAPGSVAMALNRQLTARADRLVTPADPLPRRITVLVYAAAAALVLAPPFVLLCS